MYEYGERKAEATTFAHACLAHDGQHMEPLLVCRFENDFEAQDAALQERLWTEFRGIWLAVTASLEENFGPALVAEAIEETDWVPLCGVGGVSSWKTDRGLLWIAYAQEDRGCPILLLVGKIP